MYNKKYRLKKVEEFDKKRSSVCCDGVEGKVCYLAYLNVGERGWILYEEDDWFRAHIIHTSIIEDIKYTRGNQIIVTTQNNKLTFSLVNTSKS